MGLQQLQNIRHDMVRALLDERSRNGPFLSLDEFLRRVQLTPADGSVLVKSGALDSLAGAPYPLPQTPQANHQELPANDPEPRAKGQGPSSRLNRPRLLWFVEAWLNGNSAARNNGKQTGMALFSYSRRAVTIPPLPDLSPERKRQQEIEALGFVLSVHPLTQWEPVISALPCRPVPASELAQHVGRRIWVLGWPITRKEVMTKEGEPMEFFSFEDQTAIYETVFFPKAFKRFCQDLEMDRAYLLCGRVESEFGTVSLNIQSVRKLKLLSP